MVESVHTVALVISLDKHVMPVPEVLLLIVR